MVRALRRHGCVNEIVIYDADDNKLAVWLDDDMRLRLAARDLLDAAELVVARWERGDLAEAVRELDAAIAKAKGGARMSNFLDLRCPHCGNTDRLDIAATVWLRVTENGTDADLSAKRRPRIHGREPDRLRSMRRAR